MKNMTFSTFVTSGTVRILAVAAVVALIINTIISLIALWAGASSAFLPLTPALYGSFTILGIIAGWIGWRIVEVKAPRPYRLFKVLVPVLTILSFAPDTTLALTKFIPDTSMTGVLGLMAMHIIVVACAVPAYILASARFTK